MKRWIPITILSAIAIASFAYYRKQVSLLSEFKYKIIGFTAKLLPNNVIQVNVKIRVSNESNFEATVEKVYLDILLMNTPVGFVENVKPVPIPAKSNVDVELKLVFDSQKIFTNVVSLVSGGLMSKSLQYSVQGYVKIKSYIFRITLPVKKTDNLKF